MRIGERGEAVSQQLLQGRVENPSPGGSKPGSGSLHQKQLLAVDASLSQDISSPRQKKGSGRCLRNSGVGVWDQAGDWQN